MARVVWFLVFIFKDEIWKCWVYMDIRTRMTVRQLTWAGCQVQTWTSPLSCSDTQRGYWRSAFSAWLVPRSETFTNTGWLQTPVGLWFSTDRPSNVIVRHARMLGVKQTRIYGVLMGRSFCAINCTNCKSNALKVFNISGRKLPC